MPSSHARSLLPLRRIACGFPLLVALFLALPAQAVPILSLSTSATTVNVGDSIVLSVDISGLGATEALSAYDLEIGFDTGVLAFVSASFQGFLGTSSSTAFSVAAGAQALEVSLLSAATLLATQPGSGVLVDVVLQATGVGTTGINFITPSANLLDQNANALAGSFLPLDGSIEVVPEPATVALIGGGLLLMLGVARRRC